jgi:hypothetical protein
MRAQSGPQLGGVYGHGWLALVLPEAAQRVQVDDPSLEEALRDAGASIVRRDADVLVASTTPSHGDAPVAVVEFAVDSRPGSLALRIVRRLLGALAVQVRARRARRSLARQYSSVEILFWDVGHTLPLASNAARPARQPSEWLPQRALVIGRRGEPAPTLFDAALRQASEDVGRELKPQWISVRASTIVVAVDRGVLRLAVGPARMQIVSQASVLGQLAAAQPPEAISSRIPWRLAGGRLNLVEWSLEELLPGSRPPRQLSPALQDEALEFLVGLRRLDGGVERDRGFEELAAAVGSVCESNEASRLEALGARLDLELAGLPRGFAHGDFFAGNLVADGDRLTGILDWDAGGAGRLPLLDVLHLRRTLIHDGTDLWGSVIVEQLLPELRAGGDRLVRRYCSELGLGLDPALLETLLWAYWLDHASYQLRTHAHRRTDRAWIDANLRTVLRVAAP